MTEPVNHAPEQAQSAIEVRHPLLYHYTTEAGLRGILESNAIRATYFKDLNDSKEIFELREEFAWSLKLRLMPFVQDLAKRSARNKRQIKKQGGTEKAAEKLAESWVDALYHATFKDNGLSFCSIASFCSHASDQRYEQQNGLLSQWRGYGRDGGFCIVFETAKMIALLEAERSKFSYLHLSFQEAHYPIDGANRTAMFDGLLDQSVELVREAVEKKLDIRPERIFEPFVVSAATFKHRGFFEERELRLIAMPASKEADEKIKHLPGYTPKPVKPILTLQKGNKDVQYIQLFGDTPLPLKAVIVGPSRNQDERYKLAETIVGSRAEIRKSATPFID